MKIIAQSWAKTSDLPKYIFLNEKLGYTDPKYDKCLYWSRQWEYGWIREILQKISKNQSLLDVGVTPNTRMKCLLENLDFDLHSCDIYDHRDFKNFTKCNIKENPYQDESFDNVMSISTIEHDDDPLACLKGMIRITKGGGLIILTLDYGEFGGWPIQKDKLLKFLEFLGIKSLPPYPQDLIKSEDYCSINGIRVLGLILQK